MLERSPGTIGIDIRRLANQKSGGGQSIKSSITEIYDNGRSAAQVAYVWNPTTGTRSSSPRY